MPLCLGCFGSPKQCAPSFRPLPRTPARERIARAPCQGAIVRQSMRAARRVCVGAETWMRCCSAEHCVIMANDELYGGLGDDIAIVTSSRTRCTRELCARTHSLVKHSLHSHSGLLAFVHELAHVLGDMGEEYDAGSDYSGGNFATHATLCHQSQARQDCARSSRAWRCLLTPAPQRPQVARSADGALRQTWPCVPWGHWLPTPTVRGGERSMIPPRAALMLADWPWHELASPIVRTFHAARVWPRVEVTFRLALRTAPTLAASPNAPQCHGRARGRYPAHAAG